ncbi:hypothetical protein BBJ28_00000368 [Nothophytophthora sp. Chile5]|nr:hypothetical protein BBJ28_00000368 [Nothophytophthora sp. Chile5]
MFQFPAASIGHSLRVRDKQRCCYPSKRCQNLRVMKRNGELHRLCEYHRAKANVNQRRLEQRRRMRNSESSQEASKATRANPEETARSQRYSMPDLSQSQAEDLELGEGEMKFLDEFLSQTDIELSPVHTVMPSGYMQDFIDGNADVRMSI